MNVSFNQINKAKEFFPLPLSNKETNEQNKQQQQQQQQITQ